ncbi:MAG TPA: aminodeoxychorismate synthase component I [Gemmataceae bacterium]|jgi:para-aminobenzoate synthetase component 1|nr:aminodeoxychorismate synthase component I [Gemmataceae bacterium]
MGERLASSILDPRSSTLDPALPLAEELTPRPDPWQVFQSLAGLPHLLFLDSSLGHPGLGRYSFLTADPFEWLWSRGLKVFASSNHGLLPSTDPFPVLAECLARWCAEPVAGLPPFQGGAAGLFGYDLCHHLERLPRPRFDEFETPDLAVGFYDWVIGFDHELERAWLVSTGFPETAPHLRRRRAEQRLREVKRHLSRGRARGSESNAVPAPDHPVTLSPCHPIPGLAGLTSNFDRAAYIDTVRRAIEYIHAGDCFQVNVAQRLLYPAVLSPVELYGRLRECNPATFAAYFDLGDFVIASASPERFLRVDNGAVETRPIKGTRARGRSPAEDQAQVEELLHSAKDRAENIMIVDLLRNDLGRVCRYGSVRVPAVCRLETYPFVHHLVSEVRGRLREGLGPVDLLRAAFPGGSVTGAPKIRAMEIIAELEPTARGPYCGSLGYLGFDGTMDTNILIRTFTVGRGWVQFPVGGGIVADSVPEREYEETWHKAEGLLRALR